MLSVLILCSVSDRMIDDYGAVCGRRICMGN
jgi:hypothetical protein